MGIKLELGDAFYQVLVVVRRRHWTLHIIYQIVGKSVLLEFVDPSWFRRRTL